MARLLMTGATGFVGRNLLLRLVDDSRFSQITLAVRSPKKLQEQWAGEGRGPLPAHVAVVKGDSLDWGRRRFDVDVVVHCAGLLFSTRQDEYDATNVGGTLALLKAVPPQARIVILSSQAAAGPCDDGVLCREESHKENPLTWYGKSKLAMEKAVARSFANRPIVVLRPSMVLGPRDQATLALFKMAKFAVRVKPGFSPKQYSFISVGDLVDAIVRVLTRPDWNSFMARTFFLGSRLPVTDSDLIEAAAQACGRRGVTIPLPQVLLKGLSVLIDGAGLGSRIPNLSRDRAQEIWPKRWVVSSTRFETLFGWSPQDSLVKAISDTHAWYAEKGQL